MQRRDFHYELPPELVAQHPLASRTASRLLCLNGKSGELADRRFSDLPTLLDAGDLLVFNNTRVIPARLFGRKATGGKVEVLVERMLEGNQVLAQVKASKSPKAGGTIIIEGDGITEGGGDDTFELMVVERRGDLYRLVCQSPLSIRELLETCGHMPLPPYITRQDSQSDAQRYQTVYAQQDGAVAAPTAGLHFDEGLLTQLQQQGVRFAYVTLHVGAGTFQPVRVDDIKDHQMHSEHIVVTQEVCDAVQQAKADGKRVIAVGTTSLRSLEAASQDGVLQPFEGETDIFIYPGVPVRTADTLITNFHLPESTLLMLVCAFAGKENIFTAYHHAIEQRYRFFSYGDAMLIERA